MIDPAVSHYNNMTDYLAKLYDVPLYERYGVRHPVVVFEPDDGQQDVDSVLGDLTEDLNDTFAFYDQAHLQTLKNSGRNVYNGTTFALKQIRKKPLKVSATLGTYFDMLATCGALDRELRDSAVRRFIRLPARKQLHQEIDPTQALTDGRYRSAALGGAVLTVFNHDGDYKALLARRSAKNATSPGFFHVMPAFIFQPMQDTVREGEWSLKHHIYREYLEELFGMPETDSLNGFYQHPALLDLQAMLQTGEATLQITAVAVNLLTLRAEFCVLLLIHDPTWYKRITAQDSDIPLNAAAEAEDGKLKLFNIDSDEAVLAELPPHPHTMMPPQAIPALWYGIDAVRRHIG